MNSYRVFASTGQPGILMVTLLVTLSWSTLCRCADNSVINSTEATSIEGSGIEREILGPLRIWHIVFIVAFLLILILVVVCCCIDIRVPRSRQEIEYNYKKRLMNEKYVRALERTPDEVIQQHRELEAEENKRLETISQMVAPKTLPKPGSAVARLKTAVEMSSAFRNAKGRGKSTENEETGKGNGNPFKAGVGKALPVNPRDILALVAQQQKRNAQ